MNKDILNDQSRLNAVLFLRRLADKIESGAPVSELTINHHKETQGDIILHGVQKPFYTGWITTDIHIDYLLGEEMTRR